MLKCPLIGWPHGTSDYYKGSGAGGFELYRHADGVFVISPCLEEELRILTPGTAIFLIKNPVDVKEGSYCSERNTNEIAFVGRISPEKNVPYILQAISEASRPWKLLLVGDGDENGVRSIAKELGISDRIQLLGWQENPWEHLRHAHALVQASFYEGFGLSVVEALLSGLPVISTPVGIARNLIRDGENGYLFDIRGDSSLTQVLNGLSDQTMAYPLPEDCRQSACAFLPKEALPLFENAIQSILK